MNELHHILLIEDNPNDIELTLMVLQEFNLANEVVVLKDGNLAMDYLNATTGNVNDPPEPMLVLLDLNLPGKDGREILRAMKGNNRLKNIPVIMLTSSREEADLIESSELEVLDYISKPLTFFQFAEVVARIGYGWEVVNRPPQHRLKYI